MKLTVDTKLRGIINIAKGIRFRIWETIKNFDE